MYDLHLSKGCEAPPNIIDLLGISSDLMTFQLYLRLLENNTGFLGLGFQLDTAKKMLRYLKYSKTRCNGLIVPIRYRDNPLKYNVETAFPLASRVLEELKSTRYSNLHFRPMAYRHPHSTVMYITFSAATDEWREAAIIPGAIFISVDRLDGHIWSDEEIRELNVDTE